MDVNQFGLFLILIKSAFFQI